MKLNILLGDSRILNKYRHKPTVWTSNRKKLEQDLSDEILADLIILLKDINRFIGRTQTLDHENSPPQSDIYLLIKTWISELQKLEKHHPLRLKHLHIKFGDFLNIPNPKPLDEPKFLILYSTKSGVKDIKITIDDINLKPVGEHLVD